MKSNDDALEGIGGGVEIIFLTKRSFINKTWPIWSINHSSATEVTIEKV